jgi:hypothetical protein
MCWSASRLELRTDSATKICTLFAKILQIYRADVPSLNRSIPQCTSYYVRHVGQYPPTSSRVTTMW